MAAEQSMQQTKEHFDKHGFAVVPGFLNAEQVAEIEKGIQDYIADDLPNLPAETAFYEDKAKPETLFRLQGLHNLPYFHDILHGPRTVDLAKLLLDDDVNVQNIQMFGKAPRVGNETPAHQDGYYWMLEPNEGLTMWIALDDCDDENGCIRYVDGSHKLGVRPHGKSEVFGFSQGLLGYSDGDRAKEVKIHAKPGDLIVHHALTIHRADGNPSDRRRWALGLVYFTAKAKADEDRKRRQHAAIMKEWQARGNT